MTLIIQRVDDQRFAVDEFCLRSYHKNSESCVYIHREHRLTQQMGDFEAVQYMLLLRISVKFYSLIKLLVRTSVATVSNIAEDLRDQSDNDNMFVERVNLH